MEKMITYIVVEEIEDEDDFLVFGCGSDDDIDGILNKSDEVASKLLLVSRPGFCLKIGSLYKMADIKPGP